MKFWTAFARALVGCPPAPPDDAVASSPFLTEENPLATEDGFDARQDAALKLMDEDVYGFLLLTVHREDSLRGRIELAAQLQPNWRPAINQTLELIVATQQDRA
jgi:hypothetical protein